MYQILHIHATPYHIQYPYISQTYTYHITHTYTPYHIHIAYRQNYRQTHRPLHIYTISLLHTCIKCYMYKPHHITYTAPIHTTHTHNTSLIYIHYTTYHSIHTELQTDTHTHAITPVFTKINTATNSDTLRTGGLWRSPVWSQVMPEGDNMSEAECRVVRSRKWQQQQRVVKGHGLIHESLYKSSRSPWESSSTSGGIWDGAVCFH